jgi:hypothetical protein
LKIAIHASGQKGAKIWEKSRKRRTCIPCKRAKVYRRIFPTEAWLVSWQQQQIFAPIFASNIWNAANVPNPSLPTFLSSDGHEPSLLITREQNIVLLDCIYCTPLNQNYTYNYKKVEIQSILLYSDHTSSYDDQRVYSLAGMCRWHFYHMYEQNHAWIHCMGHLDFHMIELKYTHSICIELHVSSEIAKRWWQCTIVV